MKPAKLAHLIPHNSPTFLFCCGTKRDWIPASLRLSICGLGVFSSVVCPGQEASHEQGTGEKGHSEGGVSSWEMPILRIRMEDRV